MREYTFNEIEKNLQKTWDEKKIVETKNKVEGKRLSIKEFILQKKHLSELLQ